MRPSKNYLFRVCLTKGSATITWQRLKGRGVGKLCSGGTNREAFRCALIGGR